LSGRCSGITRDGTRCARSADGPNGLCWLHDPTRSEERRRAASKAGKSKPSKEIQALKVRLEDLAADVTDGSVEPKVGAVVNQIINTRVRLMEAERKIRETQELERRLEELEYALTQKTR
jgi:hypothetical protein